jgi:SPP1 gp7 family putative phage head morphogenesis protein
MATKQNTNSKIGKTSPVRVLPWKLKSVSRSRQDIQSWNRSLNMAQFAEEPRMWPLQLLYSEIRTDALLTALIENRFQQIASANASLKISNGDVDEESTAIMRNLRAYSKINRAMFESNNHGDTVVELSLFPDNQVDLVQIPYTNIVPQKGLFYPDYTDDIKAIPYRELKEYGTWILEFNSGTLGLLNKAVPHVLYKRFAQSCHSELCEIYGIPPRVLKTNTQDSTMLSRGEQMMKDMGAAAYFIIDETETLEFAQGVGTTGDVYTNLQNFCNSELSMLFNGAVIGQDTKNGNRSKDESGQEMLWLLVQSDMRMIEQYWNHTVLPALVNLGVLPAGLRFEFEEAEDTKQLFEFTKGFMDKYNIPTDWIKEKFGVPVEEKAIEEEAEPEPDPAKPKEKKKGEKLSFFPTASTVIGANHLCCNHLTLAALPNSKDWSDDELIQRIWDAEGSLSFDVGLFYHTANTLLKGFKQGWKEGKEDIKLAAMGLEYGKDDPAMLTAYEMNLFRFSAAKTLAEAQELNRLFRDATSFEQFYQNASLKLKVFNKEWLETEYNNAIAVGAASSTYQRLMANSKVFPYWQYKTVQDDAVRPEHQLLHDIVLPYNDPRWKNIYPPNGWKCRCFVIAKMKHEASSEDIKRSREAVDAFFDTAEYAKAKAQGWGVNRSESGEVFTANQQYINKFPKVGSYEINELKAQSYGLDSYAKRKAKATEDASKYKGTAQEFWDNLEDLDNTKVLRDYKNRAVEFTKQTLKSHTTKSKESRVQYMEAMKETMKNPDEVWLKGDSLEDLVYIKYHKDETIIVDAKVKNGEVERIATWFPLKEAKAVIARWRKGLLIQFKK